MISTDIVINRVAERLWHALDDDCVVGRGEASLRSDGRHFLSLDCWHDALFDPLAVAMLAELPRPLHTVVDEADGALIARWQSIGFAPRRREMEFLLPTDGSVPPDVPVTILPLGAAEEAPLRELDRTVRAEAAAGGHELPAEVIVAPPFDPSRYVVAVSSGAYVGLLRVAGRLRQPRIGLVAVRESHRRRGIARAMLAHVLTALHGVGTRSAVAEVHESNRAAMALVAAVNARRTGSNVEFVLR